MRQTIALLFLLLAALAVPAAGGADERFDAAAGHYRISPAGSHINFSVGNVAGGAIRGRFGDFSGEITIDAGDLARYSVAITIVPASVDAGEPRTTAFLKSNAVFDAAHESAITFRSTRVAQTSSAAAAIDGRLSARGREANETFDARLVSHEAGSITFAVTGQVFRSRYGMDVGTPIYSNVVDFDMVLTGRRM
jgi:polyisoprenoid-binding protein YceI